MIGRPETPPLTSKWFVLYFNPMESWPSPHPKYFFKKTVSMHGGDSEVINLFGEEIQEWDDESGVIQGRERMKSNGKLQVHVGVALSPDFLWFV